MAKNKVINKENYNEYARVYMLKTLAANRIEATTFTQELFSMIGIICLVVISFISTSLSFSLIENLILFAPVTFITAVPSINIRLIKNELKKSLEEIKMENSQIDTNISIDTLINELENEDVLEKKGLECEEQTSTDISVEKQLSTDISAEEQLISTIKRYESYISSTLKEENDNKNKVKVKTIFKR